MKVAAPAGAVSISEVISSRKGPHIRGYLAFLPIGLQFLVWDIFTWLVIIPLAWVPHWREPVLRWWMWLGRTTLLWLLRRLGGAQVDIEPRIPCRGGELVLMNHQSLLDIPVLLAMVPDGYPRVVTNARYAKGIPGVSVMLKLYRHMLVKLGDRSKAQLRALRNFAATSEHPVAVFPEGHRSRDGELLRWKTAGLKVMLRTRKWRIHVVVVDGLWESLSMMDFLRNVSNIRCTVQLAAVHEFDPERDDVDALISQMEQEMYAKLAAMRGQSPEPQPEGAVDGRETGN